MEEQLKARLESELEEHGQLLPPWRKYPHLERYSIGWRMGYGEDYLHLWWAWTESFDREQLVAYFRQYEPFPKAWLDWVAYQLGMEARLGFGLSDEEERAVRRWLADQGLGATR